MTLCTRSTRSRRPQRKVGLTPGLSGVALGCLVAGLLAAGQAGAREQALTAKWTVAPAGAASPMETAWPGRATSSALRIPAANASLTTGYSRAGAALPPGIAQTAIDHRFDGDAGMIGSAGFLCGLQATPDSGGAAEARGSDPQGRFLGAKLSLAFR